MSTIVHGRPGVSVRRARADYGQGLAERAAAFEKIVGAALEQWLGRQPWESHLFHDLTGLAVFDTEWRGRRSIGPANIDHVIVTSQGLIVVNAKACGAGQLQVQGGHGVLVKADGTAHPQRWLDQRRDYAVADVLARDAELTGLGRIVWVVPDATGTDHTTLRLARCLRNLPAPRDTFTIGGNPWRNLRLAMVTMNQPHFTAGGILTVSQLLDGRLASICELLFRGAEMSPNDPNVPALDRYVQAA